MRTIKGIYNAEYSPIENLITYSPLPSRSLEQIDPFLFLNHHGPQKYEPGNNGLPFGPHPHRGMETVTFILDGDIMHRDSGGHKSIITAGGIQWMTAGKGLIHAETSSDNFMKNGGPLEILQLWVNLPARLKMTEPMYIGLQKDEIPKFSLDDGKVILDLISGKWGESKGAIDSPTGINLFTIHFAPYSKIRAYIPKEENIFFYVIRGNLFVNGKHAETRQLVNFDNNSDEIYIEAMQESFLLFGHARPFNEPVVAQGPFVMNTQEEIMQAYDDYRKGKFGHWE